MGQIDIYRQELAKAYPGPEWTKKVEKMSDKQVLAVWTRIRNTGN